MSHLTFTLLITSRKNTIPKIAYYPSFTVWILLFWQSAAHTKKQNKNKKTLRFVVRVKQSRQVVKCVNSSAQNRTSGRRTETLLEPDTSERAVDKRRAVINVLTHTFIKMLNYSSVYTAYTDQLRNKGVKLERGMLLTVLFPFYFEVLCCVQGRLTCGSGSCTNIVACFPYRSRYCCILVLPYHFITTFSLFVHN